MRRAGPSGGLWLVAAGVLAFAIWNSGVWHAVKPNVVAAVAQATPQPVMPSTTPARPVSSTVPTTVTPPAAHIEDASQTTAVGGFGITCAYGPTHYNNLGQLTRWQCQGPHGTTVYGTTEATAQAQAQSAWDGCPPAIHGTLTLLNNRIQLKVGLAGPSGTQWFTAWIDTGAFRTNLPNAVYQAAGYSPVGSQSETGVVPGATSQANIYSVEGDAFLVMDQGQAVPLVHTTQHVDVLGEGAVHLIGPDVLRLGAKLSLTGSQWTLQPECYAQAG